ncbi:MAG: energy-coupled thiamine transporter ThiT [Bacillota bacterium]|nr:energy-coupled thiamine transporter ThiT [Bacillota bacterium]
MSSSKSQKFSIPLRALVTCAMLVALGFALSWIKFFHMPQGGSITLFSMIPVMLAGYMFGIVPGLLSGLAYGLLQMLQDFYVVHPVQLILDYILAFTVLGLTALFSIRARKHGFAVLASPQTEGKSSATGFTAMMASWLSRLYSPFLIVGGLLGGLVGGLLGGLLAGFPGELFGGLLGLPVGLPVGILGWLLIGLLGGLLFDLIVLLFILIIFIILYPNPKFRHYLSLQKESKAADWYSRYLSLPLAVLAVGFLRFLMHALSGVVFFASYAPAGMDPWVYSIIYNGTYMVPEIVICMVIVLIPQVSSAIRMLAARVGVRSQSRAA